MGIRRGTARGRRKVVKGTAAADVAQSLVNDIRRQLDVLERIFPLLTLVGEVELPIAERAMRRPRK